MNLLKRLQEIYKNQKLDKNTNLKVVCKDGETIEGLYDGYIQGLDNEPEIAQIDIRQKINGGLVGILETEIKSIELENGKQLNHKNKKH